MDNFIKGLDTQTKTAIMSILTRLDIRDIAVESSIKNLGGQYQSRGFGSRLNVNFSLYKPEELPLVTATVAYIQARMDLLSLLSSNAVKVSLYKTQVRASRRRFDIVIASLIGKPVPKVKDSDSVDD